MSVQWRLMFVLLFFFFSSRRRHTRYWRDWSSDVCSSDLGAFAELLEFSNDFIAFLGDANFALFVGLLGAYVLCRRTLGSEGTDTAMSEGFHTTGGILLITGIGGSPGARLGGAGVDTILGRLLTPAAGGPG